MIALLLVAGLSAAPAPPPPELTGPAQAGDALFQERLGQWHDERGRAPEALAWYRKAAAQGRENSLHLVGVLLEGGRGVPRDCEGSRRAFQAAAAKGLAASVFRLGYQHDRGVCAAKDAGAAAAHYERSGTPMGRFYLGLLHEHGRLGSPDPVRAAELYEEVWREVPLHAAANQRAHLAYEAREPETAYLWYLRGAPGGDATDKRRLAELRRKLPSDARERLEREALRR